MSLQTNRLKILPLQNNDINDVYTLTSDENVARYMRFDKHNNIDQATKLVKEYIENKHSFAFSVRLLEDNSFVGVFILKQSEDDETQFDISIFNSTQTWGKGYAQELLEYMKKYALEKLGAKILCAYVVEDNIASCKALVKVGFILDKVIEIDLPCGLNLYKINL